MAKDIDLQLELDAPKVAQPQSFDLGLDLDSGTGSFQQTAFPALSRVQQSTFDIRNRQTPPPTPRPQTRQEQIDIIEQGKGQTFSTPTTPPGLFDTARNKLPRGLSQGLFGTGQEFSPTQSDRGLVGFLYEGLSKSDQRKYDEFVETLTTNAGTNKSRASELAAKAVTGQPISGLTDAESRAIRTQRGLNIAFSALETLDFIPVIGQISRGGRTALKGSLLNRILKEVDPKSIEKTIDTLGPIFRSNDTETLSRKLARTTDANEAQRLIDDFIQTNRQNPVTIRGVDDVVPVVDNQIDVNTLSRLARNSLENKPTGIRPEAIRNQTPTARTTPRAVEVRVIEDGSIDIVDGRHLLEAARGTGRTRIPINDVTSQYFPEGITIKELKDEMFPQSPLPQTAKPDTPEAVLGRTPSPMRTVRGRESTLLRDKLQQAQTISRRAAVATRKDVKAIQNDLVELVGGLPLEERGKFIRTIKNIQTPQQLQRKMPEIQERVSKALDKMAEREQRKALRQQVRQLISQKQLSNTESLRKALTLPSLNKMTVDDLRSFARNLAEFKPGDRFLSQRVLETIDRTPLKGMKTYREVQERLAKEAGVPVEDLRKIKFSWQDRFRYDTALARQNPYYDVIVRKINGSIVQGNIRFAAFEDQIDDLMTAARKSRPRGIGKRAVPTDELIFKYIESPRKEELVDQLTPEELRAANFLIERYEEARDYLLKQDVLNKYVQDYITHIRRSGLEAYRQDGLISAIKESFEQYRLDRASFEVLNNKTGEVLPLEKFFAFAQQRTGGLKPTQNVSRASKAYFMSFERKRALDEVVPELQAYAQSITPTRKTAKGLDMDPTLKNFLKEYINNKRGRPTTVLFDPGSAPDMALRSVMSTTRLIDLGFSIPNFAAANFGEQASTFIAQGTRGYARGVQRMNSKKGKQIIEKYRGFVGRSPWQEVRDTSKNWPDKMFTMMLSGFHDASVRANKQGLLATLTKEEFASGVISPERLAQIRLEMGRWRAIDNTASLYGSTGVGKMVTQYKAWAVPILSTTVDNLKTVLQTVGRGENPFTTQAGAELLRESLVVGTVALAINNYFDEEDQSFIGQLINKSARDAMSAVGALNPEMWLNTPRAWQYVQDLYAALETLVLLEEYKSGEKEGTLKGDDQLLRLITPAPVRQFGQAAEQVTTEAEETGDFDVDLDIGAVDTGLDLDLDLDLDL